MNRILTLLLVMVSLLVGCQREPSNSVEQFVADDLYHLSGTLPVEYTNEMEWVMRFDQTDIEALRQRALTEEKECDVLFFGSSSIRLWRTLAEDMAPLKVVNRGYGGAMIRDLHYHYNTVLADYKPRAFVIYCDNDLGGFGRDLHPTQLFDLYRLLIKRLNQDYPTCPIYILSVKFNDCRLAKREDHRLFNQIMADYAAHAEGVYFVDVNTPLLNADGSVNNDYFEEDQLHVNRQGYALWTSVLRPMLLEKLSVAEE